MFEILFKLYHKKGTFHIFLTSFIAFAFLNIIENGKMSSRKLIITNPSNEDWKKIIITMFIFALLQGVLTMYLY